MELKSGTTVEWFFYPMIKGKSLKLYCHKDDHEERGMVGEIEIFSAPLFSN